MKFDRYTIVGLLCSLPYLIFGVALCESDAVSILSYLLLTAALTGAEVTCYDMILFSRRKNWLYRVPFSVLFLLVQFVLSWDVMIPFYVVGQFAMGTITTKERFEHMPKRRACKPMIVAAGASLIYLIICTVTGVRV